MLNKLIYFICLFLVAACSGSAVKSGLQEESDKPEVLTRKEYEEWINSDPEMNRSKTFGKVKYTCRVVPVEYLLQVKASELSSESKKKIMDAKDSLLFFRFSIAPAEGVKESVFGLAETGGMNEEQFFEFLNFKYSNAIHLVAGTDTLSCGSYQFERVYNLARDLNFMIGFSGQSISSNTDKTLVVEDPLFGSGILKFPYTKSQISNNPKLIVE